MSEIDIPRLESWRLWRSLFLRSPEKLRGFDISTVEPGRARAAWDRLWPTCFCRGAQVFQVKDLNLAWRYCVCATCDWLDELATERAEFESPWTPALLSDLKPLSSSKEGAEDLKKLLSYLLTWKSNPTEWIFIQGGTGAGKTHILRSLRTAMPALTMYVSAEDYADYVHNWKGEEYERFITVTDNFPILLLDDWGIEHGTQWVTDSIAKLINWRNNQRSELLTVVTTNEPVAQLLSSTDIAIRRIASRLAEGGAWQLRQKDYRVLGVKS